MSKLDRENEAKCRLAAWVIAAQMNGLLSLDPYETSVTMSVKGSNMFISGQTPDDPYVFIGIHETLMPWFLDVPWAVVNVIPEANRIHLVAQMTANEQLTFILHEGNGLGDWLSGVDPQKFKLSFKEFIIMENGDIACSKKVMRKLPFAIVNKHKRHAKIQPWAQNLMGLK